MKKILLLMLVISNLAFGLVLTNEKKMISFNSDGSIEKIEFSSEKTKDALEIPYYEDRYIIWYNRENITIDDMLVKTYQTYNKLTKTANLLLVPANIKKEIVEIKEEIGKKIWQEGVLDEYLTNTDEKLAITKMIYNLILVDQKTAKTKYTEELNLKGNYWAAVINLPGNYDILYNDSILKTSSRKRKDILRHEIVHKITDYIYEDTKDHHGEEFKRIGKKLGYSDKILAKEI